MSLVESLDEDYFKPSIFKEEDCSTEETVISPSHYQVFPEFNLEVRDINKVEDIVLDFINNNIKRGNNVSIS